ncbi:MAG: hypothetical protein Q8O38_08375 [Sulfurimicrobium sp.]|nr:hypothetical protein [Sulfurimicrobium sp.]
MDNHVKTSVHKGFQSSELEICRTVVGLLVNISANLLQPIEYHEVMEMLECALPDFFKSDQTVIVGTPNDTKMDDSLRVTLFATGLGILNPCS